MNKPNWLITDNNVTVNYDGQTHIISRQDKLSDALIEALKDKNYGLIPTLVSKAKAVEANSNGKFVVKDGKILLDGVETPYALSQKIIKFCNEGLPYEPLIEFAKNLKLNPSFRSVNQLFEFLEKNDHPITDTGCFIAYKKVQDDFKDVHTGTFDNSPGKVVSMPRNQVDEDPNRTCSNGLHVANFDYATNFYAGGVMLEVEVNPKDVVAVPTDYNNSKMRVSEYKVLGVVKEEVSTPLRRTVVPSCQKSSCDDEDYESSDCDVCGDEYCDDDSEDVLF